VRSFKKYSHTKRFGLILEIASAALVVFVVLSVAAEGSNAMSRDKIAAWNRVASCESGNRWTYNGSSGFDGGLQFMPSTWTSTVRDYPHLRKYEYAYQAPAWAQRAAAEALRRRAGTRPWPVCGSRFWG
jgi:hypothetical protein